MSSNNIYGGGGQRTAMSSLDFYRRVPKDLTEVRYTPPAYTIYPLFFIDINSKERIRGLQWTRRRMIAIINNFHRLWRGRKIT